MMSKYKLLTFIYLSLAFFACKNSSEKRHTSTLFPNEDSELAILMRKITQDTENIKLQIINGESPSSSINIKDIYTDTPTDSEVRNNDWFQPMANQYILRVQDLLNNPKDQKQQYNSIIESCINCHNQVCQGPIRRIQKLKIK